MSDEELQDLGFTGSKNKVLTIYKNKSNRWVGTATLTTTYNTLFIFRYYISELEINSFSFYAHTKEDLIKYITSLQNLSDVITNAQSNKQ